MDLLRSLRAAPIALALLLMPALAQTVTTTTDPGVHVPLGEWVQAAGTWLVPLLGAASLWLIRKLPAKVGAWVEPGQITTELVKCRRIGGVESPL